MNQLDSVATILLQKLSPSGTLISLATQYVGTNPELDKALDQFDIDDAVFEHLQNESLISKLEDDFASIVPLLEMAAVPLESWAIPIISALAGPGAPFLSVGLTIACKVLLAALQAWAAKRVGTPKTT